MQSQQVSVRLLAVGSVMDKTSLSRTALYVKIKEGSFPAPVRITTQRVAWPENEVDAWIAQQVSAARPQAA